MAEVENKQVMSKRDAMLERLKNRYPDKEFADDEAMYGQISDDFDQYDNDLNGYKEREASLVELFDKNPKAAQFVTDMAKGTDPWLAVIERLGIDGVMDLMNDPSKKAEYAAKNEEYIANVEKEKALAEEYEANKLETAALLDKIQAERALSDEMRDEVAAKIMRIAQDAIIGKVTRETVDMVLAALQHDADVENARSEGMLAGRNAKIDEKLRKREGGDGMPGMAADASPAPRRRGGFSLFDEARGAF